ELVRLLEPVDEDIEETVDLVRVDGSRVLDRRELSPAVAPLGAMAAGDLDGDGDDDLVYGDEHNSLVTVPGGPAGPGEVVAGPAVLAHDVDLADVDGDGDLDAIVSVLGEFSVIAGDGRGGFVGASQSWLHGSYGGALLAAGDLDDDGAGDLAFLR